MSAAFGRRPFLEGMGAGLVLNALPGPTIISQSAKNATLPLVKRILELDSSEFSLIQNGTHPLCAEIGSSSPWLQFINAVGSETERRSLHETIKQAALQKASSPQTPEVTQQSESSLRGIILPSLLERRLWIARLLALRYGEPVGSIYRE